MESVVEFITNSLPSEFPFRYKVFVLYDSAPAGFDKVVMVIGNVHPMSLIKMSCFPSKGGPLPNQ